MAVWVSRGRAPARGMHGKAVPWRAESVAEWKVDQAEAAEKGSASWWGGPRAPTVPRKESRNRWASCGSAREEQSTVRFWFFVVA